MAQSLTDDTLFTRPTGTHALAQGLFFASVAAAVLHLVLILMGLDTVSSATAIASKGIPVALLALASLAWRHDGTGILVFLAFVACATGDVFIILPVEDAFERAIKAFAIGQGFFILAFLINREPVREISSFKARLASLVWASLVIALYFSYPMLGRGQDILIGYAVLISVMVTAALMSRFPLMLVGYGALLFLASDSMILVDRFDFWPALTYSGILDPMIWVSYFIAQAMILLGAMVGRPRRYFYN